MTWFGLHFFQEVHHVLADLYMWADNDVFWWEHSFGPGPHQYEDNYLGPH